MTFTEWRHRIVAELLLWFYSAVIVRQYFWIIRSNRTAWIATIITTFGLSFLYLKFRKPEIVPTPNVFWLVIGLPLLFVFLLRLSFPDVCFDVLNYRLIQSERSLRGAPFVPGDFFPTIFPLNPAPDTLTGIFRTYLGYRLGTIINLLSMLWTGLIVNKLLGPFISNGTWRCVLVLAVLCTEHSLVQVNSYMVDLLAIPLLFEATWLTINYQQSLQKHRDAIIIVLLLGTAMAMKLSNASSVIPVAALFVFEFFKSHRLNRIGLAATLPGLFLLPILPHAFYIYRLTGSPFFPLYNRVFKSVYWADVNVGDGRWGPVGWLQTIEWPFLSVFYPERLSELGHYSGRLTISVVAAIVCFFVPRMPGAMRKLALTFLSGSLLWSISSGYVRYALFLEMIGGVICVVLIVRLYELLRNSGLTLAWFVSGLLGSVILIQCIAAGVHVYRKEWSLRPTVFDVPNAYKDDLRFWMHDHTLTKFLNNETKALIANVDCWIVSDVKTGGIEILLRPNIPMLGVHNQEYFDIPQSRAKFSQAMIVNRGRRMYSLALRENLDSALLNLRSRGLEIASVTVVHVPFFSQYAQIQMSLIEVVTPSVVRRKDEGTKVATAVNGPLPDDAFLAELNVNPAPTVFHSGQKQTIQVTIKNTSGRIWQVKGDDGGRYYLNVGNSWLDEQQNLVNNLDGRTNLPHDVWPDETVTVPLTITPPSKPGNYVLEIDLVQEAVTWFKERGSTPLRLVVKIE